MHNELIFESSIKTLNVVIRAREFVDQQLVNVPDLYVVARRAAVNVRRNEIIVELCRRYMFGSTLVSRHTLYIQSNIRSNQFAA